MKRLVLAAGLALGLFGSADTASAQVIVSPSYGWGGGYYPRTVYPGYGWSGYRPHYSYSYPRSSFSFNYGYPGWGNGFGQPWGNYPGFGYGGYGYPGYGYRYGGFGYRPGFSFGLTIIR